MIGEATATRATSGSLPRGSAGLSWRCPETEEGPASAVLFQRYQRSEKASVLTLTKTVVQDVSTGRAREIATKLCGRKFSK
jgi:transposase-like protein